MNGITVSVILPTYNEAENIIIAINRIDAVLEGYRYEIIVVDDNSPDGTWKIAKDASRSRHNLNVIRRLHERGLSSAVLDGF
ncbi:MAG: glycosyltransferase, partial [Spirochaetota bacterium]